MNVLPVHKREYNSERRRKLKIIDKNNEYFADKIRENITPRGDGNFVYYMHLTI